VSEPRPAPGDAGFAELVGLVVGEVGDGRATVTVTAGDHHLNPAGTVHGGAIATLIDLAMGRAVASLIDDDERPVTIEMKVNFLEAGEPGELVASARVTRRGRRFTVVHADVTQVAGGETLAEAMGTFTSS
jgi:uncharacterized protein (TIGR00369 family)